MSTDFMDPDPAPAAPHDREAEEYVLACCLMDGAQELAKAIIAGVTPLTFYIDANRIVFATMLDMHAEQKVIDTSLVVAELRLAKRLDAVGGWPYLVEITKKAATSIQLAQFIRIIRDKQKLREMIRHAGELVEACHGFTGDWAERIAPALDRLTAVTEARETDRTWALAVREGREATKERMRPPNERKAGETELSWGIADFDRYFQPIETGELVVIGGYTSSGKSSLLRQIAWNFARAGHPTVLETIEVRDAEEAINLAGHISGIRSRARLNELHPQDQHRLLKAFDEMLVDHFSVSHQEHSFAAMTARARAFKRKYGLRAMGADYLQIMEDVVHARTSSERAIAIARVTGAAKQFATKENIAVILLSGFNREYVRDGNREPRLSDMEGSSAIEKDASRVLLLDVPKEYILHGVSYTQSVTADAADQPTFFVKVIQAKGRNQGTSSVGLMFHRETKTFRMIAK